MERRAEAERQRQELVQQALAKSGSDVSYLEQKKKTDEK